MGTIQLVAVNGKPTTTSNEIAAHFGKQHGHVIRAIRNLDCSDQFRLSNFGESFYTNEQGKQQPAYTITRDGFVFLAMGFTGKNAAQWKEKYIEAFNAMEAELRARAETTPAEPALPDLPSLAFNALVCTRWVLSFDPGSKHPSLYPLDRNDVCIAPETLPDLLRDPGCLAFLPHHMPAIIQAATQRLADFVKRRNA